MPSNLLITEPHPTVAPQAYTHSGRGGAGNTFRAPAHTTPSAGVPTPAYKSKSSASARFYSGVGGAGNVHEASERAVLNFDEDIARARQRERATAAMHVGVGGAGNVYRRKGSDAASQSSQSSAGGSGVWGRLSETFRRD